MPPRREHFVRDNTTEVKAILAGEPPVEARHAKAEPAAKVDHIKAGTTIDSAPVVAETHKKSLPSDLEAVRDNMSLSLAGPLEDALPHGEGIRTFFDTTNKNGMDMVQLLGDNDTKSVKTATPKFVPSLDVDIIKLKGSSIGSLLEAPEKDAPSKSKTKQSIKIFQETAKDEMGNIITQVPPPEAPPVPPSVDQCKENSAELASLLAVDDAQSQPAQEEPPRKQARKSCPDHSRRWAFVSPWMVTFSSKGNWLVATLTVSPNHTLSFLRCRGGNKAHFRTELYRVIHSLRFSLAAHPPRPWKCLIA